VNIRVVSDGEEEIGGHSVVDFLEADERGADVCIIFDGGMTRAEQPEFGLATRGLVAFHLKVKTGERDMHSGYYGGAALNAIHVLMQGLSAVTARSNGLLPDQLRVGREALTQVEVDSLKSLPKGWEILDEAGATPLDGKAADDFYDRTWAEPSLDVNGIRGGKPEFVNTTLIVEAEARFTIRLAPGQDPETIAATVEKLIQGAVPDSAEVELIRENSAAPGVFSADSRAIQLGMEAFKKATGVRPLLVRVGGTLPIYPALAAKGIPTIGTGFALRESNVHSPNERCASRTSTAPLPLPRSSTGVSPRLADPRYPTPIAARSRTTCSNGSCATSRSTRSRMTTPRRTRARRSSSTSASCSPTSSGRSASKTSS
jgi:Acetylornithine deacetylase/Succinyl-diaminopimelate desuccinylase and related deacylases